MYSNPYFSGFNQQNINERIDNQIAQLQQMKDQLKNNQMQQNQQPSINQTFQLAPNNNGGIRYANSIDEVAKENVFVDTPFFSKDLSVMWIKTQSNEIKAYELKEIVQKDEKDFQIELLMAEVEELKGMIKNERIISNDNGAKNETDSSTINESIRESIKENQSPSIPRVSKSKTK